MNRKFILLTLTVNLLDEQKDSIMALLRHKLAGHVEHATKSTARAAATLASTHL